MIILRIINIFIDQIRFKVFGPLAGSLGFRCLRHRGFAKKGGLEGGTCVPTTPPVYPPLTLRMGLPCAYVESNDEVIRQE